MAVCIIPARGGSKRIPRKNIRNFLGKPMIAWSIQAAQLAECVDDVVVTTDDAEIAEIATKWGAKVPFLRASHLANDFAPTKPVIADAIENLNLDKDVLVCCLYATAPFVQSGDLAAGYKLSKQHRGTFAASVCRFDYPIQRALKMTKSGAVEMDKPQYGTSRSQDLETFWHDAGQFYWASSENWQTGTDAIFEQNTFGIPLPSNRVQDIDTEEDWIKAEQLMRIRLNTN
ncbi:N-acylneuraminate cytidylyltransferase [Pseudovibrio ascidiaceicola]|uniref:N-acylneuraminate cytidylyltransferase n=1 Tax=Pseudovibrio ascidiaceicola TaxID=285279 RepID=A0A1I4G623_9HYPH|nr:pseudaminic acid cytidylyltransferase [Pseudovibrio ascidiaceicola]SFL25454.1 N-acylneuraminate cytidylyltransferase [Pseudovibrio ascidiaceicola]